MANEICSNELFSGWMTNYGLGDDGFKFCLWVERDGKVCERHDIDIRDLPRRPDLLARMPEEWRERFIPVAREAASVGREVSS